MMGREGGPSPSRSIISEEAIATNSSSGILHSNDDFRTLGVQRANNGDLKEETLQMMPILMSSLKSSDLVVVRQAIINGTNIFCSVLKQMALQLRLSGEFAGWLEDIWIWMLKFKDAIHGIVLEPCSTGEKVLAVKFLEIYVLMCTSDMENFESPLKDVKDGIFNISWLPRNHPKLNSTLMTFGANGSLDLLLDILLADKIQSSVLVVVINCLSAIARNRPVHYSRILSQFLRFNSEYENFKGHTASVRYSLRNAFIGFIRSAHPTIIESRDQLLRVLRSMNVGETTEQVIRQFERMSKSTEHLSRNIRFDRDEQSLGQTLSSEDLIKKKSAGQHCYDPSLLDGIPSAKRARLDATPVPIYRNHVGPDSIYDGDDVDDDDVFDVSLRVSIIDSDLTPVAKMVTMIGALLSQGERGIESLEILISNIHPDLMADIVLENMKHLSDFPFSGKLGSLPFSSVPFASNASSLLESASSASFLVQSIPTSSSPHEYLEINANCCNSTPRTDASSVNDVKRDPRRDPRLIDPRRTAVHPVDLHSFSSTLESNVERHTSLQFSTSTTSENKVENTPIVSTPASETEPQKNSDGDILSEAFKGSAVIRKDEWKDPSLETLSNTQSTPKLDVDEELVASASSDVTANDSLHESDFHSSHFNLEKSDVNRSWPTLSVYVDLDDEERKTMQKFLVTRLIDDYKKARETGSGLICLLLLTRLVAQAGEDTVMLLHEHIISDYRCQKGHELAISILYQLHILTIDKSDDDGSSAFNIYEKFLLLLAKSLIDSLPASDKSFSRLLGEAPVLPKSALALLESLCCSHGFDDRGKDIYDGDRITQGLGAVWSLILGRPLDRQACLNIALKCAVHPQDEVRSKAIRLVSNKLCLLAYASDYIEKFATKMLLSVSESRISDESKQIPLVCEIDVSSQYIPVKSESVASKSVTVEFSQLSDQTISLSQAQQRISLFFALCTKKPILFKLVFEIYGESSKVVRQSIHRLVPVLLKHLGPPNADLLQVISDRPVGSENLLMLILQIWTEDMNPSADLICAVKNLYETKVKDAAILIPILPSLAKDEVLPIFSQLVDLPLDKFQVALARILQGSASSGPALSPVDVLIAIHTIDPEKDRISLKKITDACSACFEQRTVFTHHVLAKSLSLMVEHVPLPLLFMRTVIQAINAFPKLVDIVMSILSKLVSKQIWTMPKLWVGFLKCISQTQPHSFHVLLQLPPPQLEVALTRHANLRDPLVTYVNQQSLKSSLMRSTLKVLDLDNETEQIAQPYPVTIQAPDGSSSFCGTTYT